MLKSISWTDEAQKLEAQQWLPAIASVVQTDVGRNYFLVLGLRDPEAVYEKIWFVERNMGAVVALRKSGNVQLAVMQDRSLMPEEASAICSLLQELPYKELITTITMSKLLKGGCILGEAHPRSYIGKLRCLEDLGRKPIPALRSGWHIRDLTAVDSADIIQVHQLAFEHYASEKAIHKRLAEGYGRGIGLFDEQGQLLSLLMTECETQTAANIVGVATRPAFQGRGLASYLVYLMSEQLLREGKRPHLMFDNLAAGSIYEAIGYQLYDQTVHFKR